MKPSDFIVKAVYDKDGQFIWGVQKDGHHQKIADIRGWGAIQHLFENRDGTIDEEAAMKFQDEIGQYVADAINEKMERERNPQV